MAQNYYQKEIETMPIEEMKKLQSEKLRKQVKHVYENVEYYRNLMDEKGVTPDDIKGIEDLHKLPFLTKADLRDAYPYGLLAKPLSECVRIHSTSGTTGRRVVAFYTQNDIDLWEDCCARAIVAAGGTKDDVCQVAYGYGLFTGGSGLNGGSHKVGCLTLPMSSGNTDRQIQFMTDLGSTILCCTPSYAAYIGETLKEMGLTPDDIDLKAGIFGAFHLFLFDRRQPICIKDRAKISRNLHALRSEILKRADFCSFKAQNAANAVCICEYFYEGGAKIRLFKTGSDYSHHLKIATAGAMSRCGSVHSRF